MNCLACTLYQSWGKMIFFGPNNYTSNRIFFTRYITETWTKIGPYFSFYLKLWGVSGQDWVKKTLLSCNVQLFEEKLSFSKRWFQMEWWAVFTLIFGNSQMTVNHEQPLIHEPYHHFCRIIQLQIISPLWCSILFYYFFYF